MSEEIYSPGLEGVVAGETAISTLAGGLQYRGYAVEELATEYQGKIKIGKMDVDSNSATPMRYKVTGIPTLLVFKGGQVVEQIVGYKPKEAIAQALNKYVG